MNRHFCVGIAICRYPLGGIRDSKITRVHLGPSAISRYILNGYRDCVFCRYRLRRYPGPSKYARICWYPGSRLLGWDFDVGISSDLNPDFLRSRPLFFALKQSKGQSSLGRRAGRVNAFACPPAPLAPTIDKCDCLWYDSSADQQVTMNRMQDA